MPHGAQWSLPPRPRLRQLAEERQRQREMVERERTIREVADQVSGVPRNLGVWALALSADVSPAPYSRGFIGAPTRFRGNACGKAWQRRPAACSQREGLAVSPRAARERGVAKRVGEGGPSPFPSHPLAPSPAHGALLASGRVESIPPPGAGGLEPSVPPSLRGRVEGEPTPPTPG